jgi:hypothetical protein
MMANLVREESRSVELGLMIFVECRNGGGGSGLMFCCAYSVFEWGVESWILE